MRGARTHKIRETDSSVYVRRYGGGAALPGRSSVCIYRGYSTSKCTFMTGRLPGSTDSTSLTPQTGHGYKLRRRAASVADAAVASQAGPAGPIAGARGG